MANDNQSLVVKHNALINASYNLTLVEQRLILLAVIQLRQVTHQNELDHLAFDKPIVIHVKDYMNTFKVSDSTAYETLKDACKTLFERRFSFIEPRKKGTAHITTRWVSRIAYIDETSTVELVFAPDVTPLLTYLEEHFTSYDIEQVAPLKSGYAVRLYELVISWRVKGKTEKISVEQLRRKLGIEPNQYEKMELFKRKVLDPATKQISNNTDIMLSYEQHKKGRQITDFTFSFKHKKPPIESTSKVKTVERDPNTQDLFSGLTDKQLARIVHSKKFIADYSELVSPSNSANQSSGSWINHMTTWLKKDPNKFNKRPMQEYLDDIQADRFGFSG